MCRKQKSIFTVKIKSGHSHCKRLYCTAEGFKAWQKALPCFKAQQTALLHSRRLYSRKLYCTARSSIAQQETLLHSRKFCYIAKKSVMRQKLEKSSFCCRNWRKVTSTAKTEDKHHVLPAESMLLADKTQFAHKPDQIKLQFDRSQLPYSKYSGLISQEAQPTLTKKRPTTIIKNYIFKNDIN